MTHEFYLTLNNRYNGVSKLQASLKIICDKKAQIVGIGQPESVESCSYHARQLLETSQVVRGISIFAIAFGLFLWTCVLQQAILTE